MNEFNESVTISKLIQLNPELVPLTNDPDFILNELLGNGAAESDSVQLPLRSVYTSTVPLVGVPVLLRVIHNCAYPPCVVENDG